LKVAISQPSYLPWIGYFDLIDQVDAFVFLDTVQFEKRSWQQRNRIKLPAGLSFLTVPVAVKGQFEQTIVDAEIAEPYFWGTHLRSIETNYGRAQSFDNYFEDLKKVFQTSAESHLLADLNIGVIRWFCKTLGIKTTIYRSSEMNRPGRRSELLLNLSRSLGADYYLSALGSAVYLCDDLHLFSDAGIEVGFQHYEHPEYHQLFPPFLPYASALDLLLNEGANSMEIIRSGRRQAFAPSELPAAMAAVKKG
jgi:hypothetical protein